MSPRVDPNVNNIELPCSGDSKDGNTAVAREIDEWAQSFAQTCAAPGEKDSRDASRIKGTLGQRDRKFADNLQTEQAGGEVPPKSKTTQRMLREVSPAEQQHHKELSMKDKAAFRSEWGQKVMGNFVEGNGGERKEWQTVNVEEGTYVSPSRMFAIQGGTEAEMAATKTTIEKCMRMEHPWMWWEPMGERFLILATEKKYKEVLTHYWSIFTKSSANTPTTTVEQSHSCAKGLGKAKTSLAPDEERGSGKQPSVPSSTAAAPERGKQTPTSSTPVKRAAKPSALGSEKNRKTGHRSLASKYVWVLNSAT